MSEPVSNDELAASGSISGPLADAPPTFAPTDGRCSAAPAPGSRRMKNLIGPMAVQIASGGLGLTLLMGWLSRRQLFLLNAN